MVVVALAAEGKNRNVVEEVVGKEKIVEKQEVGERRLEMEFRRTIIQMIDLSNS